MKTFPPETVTDEQRAIARFEVAARFRFTPGVKSERIGPALSALAYATSAVSPEMVRKLLSMGWLALPAAGQYVPTDVGRQHLQKALAAWDAKQAKEGQ